MAEKKKESGSAASVLIGAAFLMATSAIGPGFLTQTAVFTDKLKAAFAFAILVSILIDIVVQMNIWRILGVSGKRAQDVANEVLPGLGYFLAFLVAFWALVGQQSRCLVLKPAIWAFEGCLHRRSLSRGPWGALIRGI